VIYLGLLEYLYIKYMSENKKRYPINRANLFFSADDMSLEISIAREYLESDLNMKVVLYRVNRQQTSGDDIYNEAVKDSIRFYPPVEINVSALIDKPENKNYNDGRLRYLQDGKLTFTVFVEHLKELDTDISYGDYIGYVTDETTMKYYTVVNDGAINSDSEHTILGIKGVVRTIECAIADDNEFRGL
jgi:hypothetical protein